MKLTVVIPNLYNGLDFRADYYEAGDTLITGDSYGGSLVKEGLCQVWHPKAAEEVAQVSPIIPNAAFPPDMELISNIGSLAALMDIQGITLGHITTLVNEGITTMTDLKSKDVPQLKSLFGISQSLAKQLFKHIQAS